jgi:hypothetical protein
MAVNKTAGVTKMKLGTARKKTAVRKKAAPKMAKPVAASALKKAAPRKAKPVAATALKKATPRKAAGPKLTAPQHELLKKVVAHKGAKGYHTEKKPEHRVLETLLKHRVVKKGSKHPETKYFYYQVSTIGRKYLQSGTPPKS